ncbi:dihydrofolate reductase [archaeon 13_1_20CM_2_54_9]|nr:MAG: dihydrofolate reductase [archaeon 13_1_20CM_2_54_9]TMI27093.1 MAG: dihydrofolate reductase [Candidatus Bathyarchaeota archaeon]TMI30757.1 MAG: dihydrofolate reductase [Candidatus Bathyarchaeota archaeon]
MRNVIWLVHTSLDGFVTGPNGEMDWIRLDDELFEDVHALVSTADTALFGRVTYQLMEGYWPTAANRPTATKHDIEHSQWLNPALKIVFSRILKKAQWQNTKIVAENIRDEMAKLKEQPGKNLILFASPNLASTFMNLDLIDEYRFNVNPIVLGRGKALFTDLRSLNKLKLLESKTYKTGVVKLHYSRTGE